MMKKIDIHAHVVPKQPFPDDEGWVRVEELIDMYDRLGIERGVLLPIVSCEGSHVLIPNEHVMATVEQYPDRFDWFCNVDPRISPNHETTDLSRALTFYKDRGAKGVGEITTNLPFDDPKMDNLFSHCEACEMPLLFHISPMPNRFYGIVDEMGLPGLERALKRHKNLKFIGHSQPFWAEISSDIVEEKRNGRPQGKVTEGRLIQILRENENLYCDLSAGSGSNAMMRDPEFAVKFLNEFSDRVFYACDICLGWQDFPFRFSEFLEGLHRDGALSDEVYRKICRDNAIRILGIRG